MVPWVQLPWSVVPVVSGMTDSTVIVGELTVVVVVPPIYALVVVVSIPTATPTPTLPAEGLVAPVPAVVPSAIVGAEFADDAWTRTVPPVADTVVPLMNASVSSLKSVKAIAAATGIDFGVSPF